ncbi:unnamed protein product [Durusdinium trenchii]|uniref:RING-type domain-containing protein n=1 Tax=Durusdinium trenchii TaxID=1381693 RepID=A0ABP0Q7J7_9DINO
MARALVAQPPAKAPWARCLLRRDGHDGDFHAEVKTDWAPDEAVRQSRAGIFNAMKTAVKESPGGATWNNNGKTWLLRGGVTAAEGLIQNLRDLGFTFADGEVDNFLQIKRKECPVPSAPFEDAFADEDADLDEWLSSGVLDSIEEGLRKQEQAVPASAPEVHASNSMRSGLSVRISGVMSHPQLNGCLGTLDAVEESSDGGPRWLVSVKGQQYSLPEEKLRLEPVPEALVTDPPPSTDELPHSQEKPDPATAATEPTSSRAEPSEAQEPLERRDQRECAICMEEPATTVFVPCGHMAACRTCGERFSKKPCPVCRKKIKRVQQVFAV